MGLLNLLSLGLGVIAGSQISLRAAGYREPRPFPHQFARLLDHVWRLKWRSPVQTLDPIGIAPGMTLLDLGCGTGTYTAEMARLAGPSGTVHAVDIQAEMVAMARRRVVAHGGGDHVQFHHRDAYRLPLPDNSIDIAVLVAVLGEIPDRVRALRELYRVLKPDGRLVISDEVPMLGFVLPVFIRGWLRIAGFRYGGQTIHPLWYTLIYFKDVG